MWCEGHGQIHLIHDKGSRKQTGGGSRNTHWPLQSTSWIFRGAVKGRIIQPSKNPKFTIKFTAELCGSQSVVPGLRASASPENFRMHVLRSHPDLLTQIL